MAKKTPMKMMHFAASQEMRKFLVEMSSESGVSISQIIRWCIVSVMRGIGNGK